VYRESLLDLIRPFLSPFFPLLSFGALSGAFTSLPISDSRPNCRTCILLNWPAFVLASIPWKAASLLSRQRSICVEPFIILRHLR
jgi:hypothetical protein